jgi:hypothetical protein
MANEFVARRGIIAQSGGAKITGSLLVSGTIDATGYNVIAASITGSFSGSIGTATTASYVSPSGLPAGTVSASSQIDYNSIQNKLSGVVSSSAQVQPLLPGGTVSSSAQYPGWVTSSAQVNTGSFTGSFIGAHTGSILAPGVVSSSAQYPGWVTSSTQIVWSSVAYNAGIVSSSGQVQPLLPGGTVSSSAQYPGWVTSSTQIDYNSIQNKLSGVVSSSAQVAPLLPANTVSSSGQVTAFLPTGTVSSSTQFKTLTDPFTGSFTGSFTGDGSGLTGIATVLGVSGSTGTATINLKTQALTINGGNGVTTSATGQSVTVSAPAGTVTASSQIDYNSIQNKLSGVYSSSTQAVAAIAGQTIAPSIINATGAISGASIQVGGNGIIGGNLNVLGTLTATSQSVQYISSSTLNVATNKIIVNTDNSLRFGGLTVIDSGSSGKSGSLYWDSINDRWLYEDVSGGAYTSAIIVAGPQNTGATGGERGLLTGRVPVASGDDHIDTAAASSSIRVDFPSRLTHVEAGLFITGNLTANGTVTLQGIPSSSTQVQTLLPGGTVSSSAQYPGWMTSSAQVVWSSVNYNTGIVSSSTQVQPLLPGGTVSSSAQYPGWVTASSQIQLASITGTTFAASNFTFPQQLTVSGVLSGSTSAYLNNTLYSGSAVTGIVGPVTNQVVASFATGSYNAAYFDYTINDGTNYRAGTVMSVWNPSTIEYTETSTNDLGNTAQATFVVDVVSGIARLKFSNVSGTWSVKTGVRAV